MGKLIMFRLLAIFLLVWSPVGTFCLAAPNLNAIEERALVLHQKDYYRGLIDVIITPSALRMDLNGGAIYLVAKAPDWRVVFFNSRDKVAMDMTLEEYLLHRPKWWPFERSYPASIRYPPLEKIGTITYLGKSCLKFGQLNVSNRGIVNPARRYQAVHYVWTDPR